MSILDSRDLEQELNNSETEEARKQSIKELKKEAENSGWEHGIFFISDFEWKDYCKDMAIDCGYISRSKEYNPLEDCIDWDKWSDLVKNDYSEIEFEGATYYWREA
jgi:hypothetical protein